MYVCACVYVCVCVSVVHSRTDYGAVFVDAIRCFSDTVIYYSRFFYRTTEYEHITIENKREPSIFGLPINFVFFVRKKSGNILSDVTVNVTGNEYICAFLPDYTQGHTSAKLCELTKPYYVHNKTGLARRKKKQKK